MEEFDNGDDFSDLYADVEVQASSAISAMHGLKEMTLEKDGKLGNAIDGFPQLPSEDDEFIEDVNLVEKVNGFIEIDNAAINSGVRENVDGDDDGEGVEEHGCLFKLPIENGDSYEDGSLRETEDDLNIIWDDGNDGKYNNNEINGELGDTTARKRGGGDEHKEEEENGEGINGNEKSWNSGACHSQLKYTRPHPASFSSHFNKGKSSVGTGLEDIGCGQLMDASPVIHRGGESFCLPRSRTVLDVDIDLLENKAWRHPRADMTKIFSFGCDEDGYKRYCSDVDRCQKQKIMPNRIHALKFPQHTKPKLQTEDNVSKNRTSSHGRHSVDQNSDVATQDLKADHSDSETMTLAHQLVNYGPSKNGGSDIIGNGDLHFNSTSEDDPPSLRRNDEGRVKIASGRHISAHDPVPLDLDKYGSVQISDSEEDNHHEMSDSGSDGGSAEAVETSDDMNRRNSSSTSNKVSSRVKPEKFLSAQSHHGPGFSYFPSPSAAENIHRHSRKPSSGSESSVSDLRVSITCGYHPSKDSKSHGVKPNTRDGRCCERDNGPNEKDLMWRRRSHHVPKLKPDLIDENASNSFGGNHLHDKYQSTISHTKQSARLSFYSTEKGMPYRNKGYGSFSPYSGGLFPDYHLGPAHLQKQNWNSSPSFGYEANWCDGHSMNRKLNFLKKKTKLDYEAFVDNCYHNERRHYVHETNPIKFEESKKLIPKNFYMMNGRGTQFSEKGDGVQFRRRMIRDNMPTLHEYNYNFLREKYRRYTPSVDRDGDHLDYRYDRNEPRDIRKMESHRSGKRRCDNPLNRFDNSWCMENGYSGTRCIKHRPLSIRPHKESIASRRGQFHEAAGLNSDVVAIPVRQRRRESSLHPCNNFTFDSTKNLGYCGHVEDHLVRRRDHQQYTDTVNANKTIKNYHNQEHFVRKRYHQPPDILHLNEEVYKSRWQDGTGKMFPSKGSSYKCERISRNRRPNDGYALDCVAEIVDEGEVHKCKYKLMREDNCGNKFLESSNFMHLDNSVQMNSSYRYSVDPCSVEGKEWQCTLQSSRRCSDAEGAVYYGRYDFMDWNDDKEPEKFSALVDFKQKKAVLANKGKFNTEQFDKSDCSKFSGNHQNKFVDIEEGQIITEEINDKSSECMIASEDVTQINDAKHSKTHSDGDNVMEGIDDQRIQEARAKMEKRGERFKDPITLIGDSGKTSKLLPYLEVETAESKLGRPARKRQWAGN